VRANPETLPVLTGSDRRRLIKSVVLVSSGNFLDMYDFMVFGYYAPWIGREYFPSEGEFASLMLTFALFGAGLSCNECW
jgi:MHS family citrate/tricarballylate:H+ symporter-like MFS transporter